MERRHAAVRGDVRGDVLHAITDQHANKKTSTISLCRSFCCSRHPSLFITRTTTKRRRRRQRRRRLLRIWRRRRKRCRRQRCRRRRWRLDADVSAVGGGSTGSHRPRRERPRREPLDGGGESEKHPGDVRRRHDGARGGASGSVGHHARRDEDGGQGSQRAGQRGDSRERGGAKADGLGGRGGCASSPHSNTIHSLLCHPFPYAFFFPLLLQSDGAAAVVVTGLKHTDIVDIVDIVDVCKQSEGGLHM